MLMRHFEREEVAEVLGLFYSTNDVLSQRAWYRSLRRNVMATRRQWPLCNCSEPLILQIRVSTIQMQVFLACPASLTEFRLAEHDRWFKLLTS